MRTGRPKATLTISSEERSHLLAITRSRSLPAVVTLRAKMVWRATARPATRRVNAAWRRPPYDPQMAQSLDHRSDRRALRRDA
jgi:hypothetical protein